MGRRDRGPGRWSSWWPASPTRRRTDSGSSKNKPLVIVKDVQRLTLQDTVTLNGTLAAQGAAQGHDGLAGPRERACTRRTDPTADAGARLFALDGRDAIAEPGDVRFFRPLDVGDRGDDVLQLKQILAAVGLQPRPDEQRCSPSRPGSRSRSGRPQHHYPGAVPRTPQTVTVSLGQGSGYKIGAQSSAGLIIGRAAELPHAPTAARSTTSHRVQLTAFRGDVTAVGRARPEDPVDERGRVRRDAGHVPDHRVGGERERHRRQPRLERYRDEQRRRRAAVDRHARRPTPPRCR